MQKKETTVTLTEDIAVRLHGVSKCFVQWQRSGKVRDIVRNLIRPDKKELLALNDVSLSVRRGEFVAYAGANGAGKSTTIKLLAGILQPSNGQIRVLGLDPATSRIELMRHLGIVFGNRTELWWDQPVSVSFDWKQVVWDIPKEQYARVRKTVVELLDLGDLMSTFVRELSLGQQMRADLGLMLLHEPELILLDEPTLGLDVLAKRHMIDFLKKLNREQNTTIIVTSHDMDDLEAMAQKIVLLSHGRIAFEGNFDELRQLTGGLRRISVTTQNAVAPQFTTARHIHSTETIHEYEFDSCRIPVKELLAEIALLDDVLDIETGKAPIEQVITELYTQWNTRQSPA